MVQRKTSELRGCGDLVAADREAAVGARRPERGEAPAAETRGPRLEAGDSAYFLGVRRMEFATDRISRVVLLGNLAHYMSPLYGQREAMEVEDAVTLAELLGDEELTVDEALEEYSSRRVERVSKIQEESLRVNDGFEKELGTAKRALNAVRMRAKFSSSKLKSQSQLFFGSS